MSEPVEKLAKMVPTNGDETGLQRNDIPHSNVTSGSLPFDSDTESVPEDVGLDQPQAVQPSVSVDSMSLDADSEVFRSIIRTIKRSTC